MKRNVLIVYALNEYPTRKMMTDLLYSFRRHSNAKVIYFNRFMNRMPDYLKHGDYDAIIFHQSVTSCEDVERYRKRIEDFKHFLDGSKAIKVALFQDEYVNTDASVEFLNALSVDFAFTVAPETEWHKIYKGIRKECKIIPMLTGYVEEKEPAYYQERMNRKRTIDVGYRAVWDKSSIILGEFGYDKIRIAKTFQDKLKNTTFVSDIKVGRKYLIKGKQWNDFLSSCRFVLGVESGAGVLDNDGTIYKSIRQALVSNPEISLEDLYEKYVKQKDDGLRLRAISPRHFEAIEEGACQILYEGEYNGILKPGVHYIELKKDHSNLDDVIEHMKDEENRKKIVESAYRDVIGSQKYTYEVFVKWFYEVIFEDYGGVRRKQKFRDILTGVMAAGHEKKVIAYIVILQALKKNKLINRFKQTEIARKLTKGYYAKRL